jgi:hypothetical protein
MSKEGITVYFKDRADFVTRIRTAKIGKFIEPLI